MSEERGGVLMILFFEIIFLTDVLDTFSTKATLKAVLMVYGDVAYMLGRSF